MKLNFNIEVREAFLKLQAIFSRKRHTWNQSMVPPVDPRKNQGEPAQESGRRVPRATAQFTQAQGPPCFGQNMASRYESLFAFEQNRGALRLEAPARPGLGSGGPEIDLRAQKNPPPGRVVKFSTTTKS